MDSNILCIRDCLLNVAPAMSMSLCYVRYDVAFKRLRGTHECAERLWRLIKKLARQREVPRQIDARRHDEAMGRHAQGADGRIILNRREIEREGSRVGRVPVLGRVRIGIGDRKSVVWGKSV